MTEERTSRVPGEQLSEILAQSSQQISALAGELSASYEKEIGFLNGMMWRDRELARLRAQAAEDSEAIRELKELRDRQLKKIWWLEGELNRQKSAAAEAEKLKRSRLGRVQRRYWRLRSRRG